MPVTVSTQPESRSGRYLFLIAALWGACIFWLAHHPPMTDVPQHAGQVALLLDMARGVSPWSEVVRLNLGTPYLIGYGLALPLSFFMPIVSALKILLTVSYLAFVAMGVVLRRRFGGDPRLDWLFLLAFFGYAGIWGFLPFLVSTPIVLLLIYISDRHAEKPGIATASAILAVGLVLVVSHGLAFFYGWVIGVALVLAHRRRLKSAMLALVPFLLLMIPFGMYAVASRRMTYEIYGAASAGRIAWDYSPRRLIRILIYSVGGTPEVWVVIVALLFMAAPWVMGLRIAVGRPARWVPFLITLVVAVFVPESAIDSSGLYSRFLMFFFTTYAWMFDKPGPARLPTRISQAVGIGLAGICCCVLAVNTWRTVAYDREEADFRSVLETMQPGYRALGLVFGKASDATHHKASYLHQALWYQAEKHGFVDFNFASFPPQMMRFRRGHVPVVAAGFDWYPQTFEWKKFDGDIYHYFVVQRGPDMPADIFKGAPCAPVRTAAAGDWAVYENKPCK